MVSSRKQTLSRNLHGIRCWLTREAPNAQPSSNDAGPSRQQLLRRRRHHPAPQLQVLAFRVLGQWWLMPPMEGRTACRPAACAPAPGCRAAPRSASCATRPGRGRRRRRRRPPRWRDRRARVSGGRPPRSWPGSARAGCSRTRARRQASMRSITASDRLRNEKETSQRPGMIIGWLARLICGRWSRRVVAADIRELRVDRRQQPHGRERRVAPLRHGGAAGMVLLPLDDDAELADRHDAGHDSMR